MGWLSKINEKRKKATNKVLSPFTKGFAKISDKIIPNELRWMAPYAAGIGTLALGPTMGPWMRALAAGGMNVAGQIAADESSEGDLSDINLLSTALAGGIGALGSEALSGSMRGGIESGMSPQEAANIYGRGTPQALAAEGTLAGGGTGAEFLQGAENLGREGIAAASDFVTGGRKDLVNLGKNPGNLFSSANKFKGARDAAKALGPTFSHATGDVAYEAAIDAQEAQQALDAEEQAEFDSTNKATDSNRAELQIKFMRQAGHDEETIIETLDMNDLGEYYTAPVEGAAYGGLMGRPEYEFGGITEALKNAGARGLMTQNKAMGGIMSNDKTYHQYHDQTRPMDMEQMMGYNMGGSVLPQGMEMDYRGGGFIPIGSKERADDVKARVSKNEFVMTADAVKAAGGGSVNEGARRMYNLMNNLEAKA